MAEAKAKITLEAPGLANVTANFKKLQASVQNTERATKALRAEGVMMSRAMNQNAAFDFSRSWRGKLDGLKNSLFSVRSAFVAVGGYMAVRFVGDSIRMASAVEDAERAFVRLASKRGSGNARDVLVDMSRAMDGMLDRSQVAAAGVKILGSNSALTADQLLTAASYARTLSDATGDDLESSIERVVGGLSSMHTITLRTLLLEADTEAAVKATAAAMGKQVDELTATEKQGAKVNAIIDEMRRKQNALGVASLDAGDNISKVWANLRNLMGKMGEGFAEIFGPLISLLSDWTSGKFEGSMTRAAGVGEGNTFLDVIGDAIKFGAGEPIGLADTTLGLAKGEKRWKNGPPKRDPKRPVNMQAKNIIVRSAGGG